MTNNNKNNDDLTNKFNCEHDLTTISGLQISYQLRNLYRENNYGRRKTGDWNSLVISTYPNLDSPFAVVIDIWNIYSKDIENMITALTKIKEELTKQESVRKQIEDLQKG
jgi:hypothetical protein